jgi:hypothetical protein
MADALRRAPEDARDGHAIVVVPGVPGPLIELGKVNRRSRDDLDELIDELLPDSDDGPGWFDLGLIGAGVGMIGWGVVGPRLALFFGIAALVLGCVLPIRSGWRRIERSRDARRRSAALAGGVPMTMADPVTARLVRAYEAIIGAGVGRSAVAAAHSAVLEVASLLRGRAPASDGERAYVTERAKAIEDLAEALHERQSAATDVAPAAGDVDPAVELKVRQELEMIGGVNSLAWLKEVTDEVRTSRGHR